MTRFIITLSICKFITLVFAQQSCTDSQNCLYPPTCKRLNFTRRPDRSGPLYDHLLSNIPPVRDVDNVCATGFSVGVSTYLIIRVLVFKDGKKNIEKAIYSEIPGFPGAYRGEELANSSGCSSCIFNDYYLGGLASPCDGVFVLYRCLFYGDCVAENNGPDMLFGFSVDKQISDYCYSKLVEFVEPLGLEGPGYVRLPYNNCTQCVNDLNQLAGVSNNNGSSAN